MANETIRLFFPLKIIIYLQQECGYLHKAIAVKDWNEDLKANNGVSPIPAQ